jgi:hypothetical protein
VSLYKKEAAIGAVSVILGVNSENLGLFFEYFIIFGRFTEASDVGF